VRGASSWFLPLVTGSGVTLIVTLLLDAMRHRRARADAAEDAARAEATAHAHRVDERSEAAATAVVPLLDQLNSLFQTNSVKEEPPREEVEGLLVAIRKYAIAIKDPEVRRRLDILVECGQNLWAVRSQTGHQPVSIIWMASGEVREALGQLIRRENISASSDLLDKYKNAVETEYQLMAEEYEDPVREASQAGANKSREADDLRKEQ
jgi:hypothetical protein